MPGQFKFEGDLVGRLSKMEATTKRAMVASAGMAATQGESFMKSNAPWTDRTSAARNGLKAQVVVAPNKVAIVMYHSVPYGVWLEIRWGGKYGIIPMAMAATGPYWVQLLSKMIFDEV